MTRTPIELEPLKPASSLGVESRVLITSRNELWAFYLYYVGNSGLSGFNFGPSQFQNLLYLAGYDPSSQPPFYVPCSSGTPCVLQFLGKARDINSIVLLTNGISFAIQAVLLLVIGTWADYGQWRPNITIIFTLAAVAPHGALTFWTAAFPGLTRHLFEVQESAKEVKEGTKNVDGHTAFESLSRNRVSNISFAVSSVGEIFVLVIMVGILEGMKAGDSTENNTRAFSALIAFSGAVWLICALPWFFIEKHRPGLSLPPGSSLLTIGFRQTYVAIRECLRLKQTFLYLIFYFLMGDVLNTTVTVIGTLQNSVVSYSTFQLTLLLIVGILTQAFGIYGFWLVQKAYKISTKAVLFYGLMVCPWYTYSQTMISEVSPLPQMYVGKTSAFIGPLVSSAIITASGDNNNMPFAILFGLGAISTIFLYLVDVKKSRVECEEFVEAEANREAFGESSS
ncbi:hypothetical protein PAXINDRAFT_164557 [Paxillus involutus ATCC 200175]|uniref:Autophagy-related protein n=1 Tax=Paxillus involutus ATCC 200175 TaxID=664439 RepID=A0A0C9T9I8_PAXIN|nr:hypothetical protein PAXINDRAFT_164557 [Paxillus involutus ATCC 200175]